MFTSWQQTLQNMHDFLIINPVYQALLVLVSFNLMAVIVSRFILPALKKFTDKSNSQTARQLVEDLDRPLFISLLLLGITAAISLLPLAIALQSIVLSILATMAIYLWAKFILQASRLLLRRFANDPAKFDVLHAQTLPLFENIAFLLIFGLAIYYIFINWNIDMTAWLASAGIIGIAVGFAAKDTLANLFSGVFIMADAPYKIGDFVVLDSGERGEVTKIGLRSTRLLTRDDVEVTVPNSVMGNSKVTNESGGRHEKFRIRVQIGVAYGSDVDQVRAILSEVGKNTPDTCSDPEPRVRFRTFGPSSLNFELLCWIEQPVLRGRILDRLNTAVYKEFINHGIEIPYSKQDLYIKEMPKD